MFKIGFANLCQNNNWAASWLVTLQKTFYSNFIVADSFELRFVIIAITKFKNETFDSLVCC